jgi:hypothetical protein
MSYNQYKSLPGVPTIAPNLPVAPTDYSLTYQDQLNNALRLYFAQIDAFTQYVSIPNSGTTEQRPGAQVYVGQMYFDTTLNIPVWWNGKHWVNSSGTTV